MADPRLSTMTNSTAMIDPKSNPQSLAAKDRDDAEYMSLNGAASSEQAKSMVAALAGWLHAGRKNTKHPGPSKPFVEAVGAVVYDLYRTAHSRMNRWTFRSHRGAAFSDKRIGARTFNQAIAGMRAEGLIDFIGGHQQHVTFGGLKTPAWKKAPRVRATKALFDLGSEVGITPSTHHEHFEVIEELPEPKADVIIQPLQCRTDATRYGSVRAAGASLPIDLNDPEARRLYDELVRLNAYLAAQEIGGASHRGFKRIFHATTTDGFSWDKGGRLYSVGGANYQQEKKEVRSAITINGERVVELDITASHLTILHAMRGVPLDLSSDPYDISELPRDVVKTWVTMTLGHDKLHIKWPSGAKDRLESGLVHNLGKSYPIKDVSRLIIDRYALFGDWHNSTVRWPDFQFLESEAVVGAMAALAFEHDVPCLPVHDSIIVPASQAPLAERVLRAAFKASVGVQPGLKET